MKWIAFFSLLTLVGSCNDSKEKTDTKNVAQYVPIRNYINEQLAGIDSSMVAFTKIETIDGRSDTTTVPREEIRKLAADFLQVPDVKNEAVGNQYTEHQVFDTLTKMFTITYIADDKNAEFPRQEISVLPQVGGADSEVKSIYIERYGSRDGAVVEKKMLWEMNRQFRITTITQRPGGKESIRQLRVLW